jgi:hypothetical protein
MKSGPLYIGAAGALASCVMNGVAGNYDWVPATFAAFHVLFWMAVASQKGKS